MKVTMVCENSLPMSTGGGPRLNQWAITDELRMRGHEVQVVYITYQQMMDGYGVYCLGSRGVQVVPIALESCTPSTVSIVINSFKPNVIFSLGTWGISWAAAYDRRVPRVCMMGDPEHIINGYRRQLRNREPMTYEEIAQLHNQAMQIKDMYLPLLQDCTYTFCGAKHSTDWFNAQGIGTEYVPMPIPEPAFPGWRRREEDMPKNAKPRILMAGHLGGIATLSGLYYLLDHILPHMPDYKEYDWHICGGDELQEDLKARFSQYPEIKFRGFVPDIRKEILQADVFLCPTSSTCGVRTRLVEVMALGGCIVAHSANGVGQPEFENGSNLFMSDTGNELVDNIEFLSEHKSVRAELGERARRTFEDRFRTELSAGRIIDVMQEISR